MKHITNIVWIVAVTLFVTGCAELEVQPGRASSLKNAPINEASRAGIVSYSKEAMDEDDERQEAYDTMLKSCHGAYKIIKEELRRGGGDFLDSDGKVTMGMDEDRVYITFSCVHKR